MLKKVMEVFKKNKEEFSNEELEMQKKRADKISRFITIIIVITTFACWELISPIAEVKGVVGVCLRLVDLLVVPATIAVAADILLCLIPYIIIVNRIEVELEKRE